MKVINFDSGIEQVKATLKNQPTLSIREIQHIFMCSLPTVRKAIKAMIDLGVIYEINGYQGKRYVKESPSERQLQEMERIRERELARREARRNTRTMVFLCKGKTTEGNRIFQECKTHSPIQRMDDLLRGVRISRG